MLTPPSDLAETTWRAALADRWGLGVAAMNYRAVGFGAHHWELEDVDGGRWFVTVTGLRTRRVWGGEPLDAGFGRLRGSAGSYARRVDDLLAAHPGVLGGALERYDRLVAGVHDDPPGLVLTHGEPHPLTEIAIGLDRFRAPHGDTADDEETWNNLAESLATPAGGGS
ncbi:hypothetical protein [Actinoplanes sp. NPDC089786]|uniref:hypothetical protein n=1 Tax=Actinoplanes sp. NPDC089786 TaxID=3155185 RepID=UPI00343B224F